MKTRICKDYIKAKFKLLCQIKKETKNRNGISENYEKLRSMKNEIVGDQYRTHENLISRLMMINTFYVEKCNQDNSIIVKEMKKFKFYVYANEPKMYHKIF